MHVTLENLKHLVSGQRLWAAQQALIFHPTDYRRQHFGILLRLTGTQYLEKLPGALQQNLLMGAHQFRQARVEQGFLTEGLFGEALILRKILG